MKTIKFIPKGYHNFFILSFFRSFILQREVRYA